MIGSALGIASMGTQLGTDIASAAKGGKSKGKGKEKSGGDKAGKILEALQMILQAVDGGKGKKAGGAGDLLSSFSDLSNIVGDAGGKGGGVIDSVGKIASKL